MLLKDNNFECHCNVHGAGVLGHINTVKTEVTIAYTSALRHPCIHLAHSEQWVMKDGCGKLLLK
jgi:hypothetical protein